MYYPPFVHLFPVKMWMSSIGGNEISAYYLPPSWDNVLAYHGGYGPRTLTLPKPGVVRTKDESKGGPNMGMHVKCEVWWACMVCKEIFSFCLCMQGGVPKDLAIPKVVCLCTQVYNFLVSHITKLGLCVCYTSSMTMQWQKEWVDFVKIKFHLNTNIERWGHAIWIQFN